jgi:hypothetical protein
MSDSGAGHFAGNPPGEVNQAVLFWGGLWYNGDNITGSVDNISPSV